MGVMIMIWLWEISSTSVYKFTGIMHGIGASLEITSIYDMAVFWSYLPTF